MKTRTLLLPGLVAFVASGCAFLEPLGGPGMQSKTRIDTSINVVASGNSCTFQGSVPDIYVQHGNSGTLYFHLQPATGFKFTANGIDFSVSGAPAGEFRVLTKTDKEWVINDRNMTKNNFKYDVHVIPIAPGAVECKLDPIVFNDGTCTVGCG